MRDAGTRLAAGGAIALVLAASRVLLAPTYLYHFDSVNFALALTDFNPIEHQPQPPGYPLFVALSRVFYWLARSPQLALVLTGVFGSLLAMLLVWELAREMFGERAGTCAALLLLFHPAFWFGGLTSQVRVFLAAGAAAAMLAVWRSLTRDSSPAWFYAAAGGTGVLAGFRPMEMLWFVPLIVWAGVRTRRSAPQWFLAAALAAAGILVWLIPLVIAVSGPAFFVALVRQYAEIQFSQTSLAWGAGAAPAAKMLKSALLWYSVPLLSWTWALPFVWRRLGPLKESAWFLTLSFLPGFLFHALIHVGDPDHTLSGVPALCLIGAFALSRLDWAPAAATAAAALNAFLFFSPPPGEAARCGYAPVAENDRETRAAFRSLEELRPSQPLVLVTHDHPVTWRHLFFYFPQYPVYVLHADPRNASPPRPWIMRERKRGKLGLENGELPLPAGSKIVWLLARGRGLEELLGKEIPLRVQGTVLYSEAADGMRFRFGSYPFRVRRSAEIPMEDLYSPRITKD